MMNSTIQSIIETHDLGALRNILPVSGGSINETFRVETDQGVLFVKLNDSSRFPNMFEAERTGLKILSKSSFRVPKPVLSGIKDKEQFLILDWIREGNPNDNFWNDFGICLAQMHTISNEKFGLDASNYIGSLKQSNKKRENWTDFYRDERLLPQMKLAEKSGLLSNRMKLGFDTLFNELHNIYPTEKSSLLHGDLWSGNMMVDSEGFPTIFDPAVYFGHREMDLAMMALFGGFGHGWIESYNEIYSLEPGWQQRIPIGQLYPLMVHVNLFGGSYVRSVETILQKLT